MPLRALGAHLKRSRRPDRSYAGPKPATGGGAPIHFALESHLQGPLELNQMCLAKAPLRNALCVPAPFPRPPSAIEAGRARLGLLAVVCPHGYVRQKPDIGRRAPEFYGEFPRRALFDALIR